MEAEQDNGKTVGTDPFLWATDKLQRFNDKGQTVIQFEKQKCRDNFQLYRVHFKSTFALDFLFGMLFRLGRERSKVYPLSDRLSVCFVLVCFVVVVAAVFVF